jgi:lipoprotein-anchoring transpeptidase ErfK/SrfK
LEFLTTLRLLPAVLVAFVISLACGGDSPPQPEEAPTGTSTRLPGGLPTPTPSPSPTPVPLPELSAGDAIVVGGLVRARADPSTSAAPVGTIQELAKVNIAAQVRGENWLVGSQTWVTSVPDWTNTWYQLGDGSFVYGAFVFILAEGEMSPFAAAQSGQEKWIDVDLSEQRARAMVGDQAVFVAAISSGAAQFPTPVGSFAVQRDGRIPVEKMTASQAGYQAEQAQYDVERVLFTQYFDLNGDALHLNYWRPHSVFGRTPTSHGCIGLELHEAQYLWLFASAGTRVEIHP